MIRLHGELHVNINEMISQNFDLHSNINDYIFKNFLQTKSYLT